MADWTIAKLAGAAGVGVETIRYYQRRGLLRTPDRLTAYGRSSGVRRYNEDDLGRLQFIRSAQRAGFTLDEIATLLELDSTQDRTKVRRLAEARLVALDAKIDELQAARAALARLAQDCRMSGSGPCPIIEAFERQ